MLRPTELTQASFLQKNKMWQNIFLDIFNAEISQCRRKLDVILGTKVVQFWSYQKWFFLNVVLTWYLSMKNWLWMSRFHDFWHHCAISALQIYKKHTTVTYAAAEHQRCLFWITCKWRKLVAYKWFKIQCPLLFGGVNVTSQ